MDAGKMKSGEAKVIWPDNSVGMVGSAYEFPAPCNVKSALSLSLGVVV